MNSELIYRTQGTCSQAIRIVLDDNQIVKEIQFAGGCNGNTKGVASLAVGMKATDVIERLRGITCGAKTTSCPDQLSKALEQMINQ